MKAEEFVRLSEGGNALPFNQLAFRRRNLPGCTHPLCAGLVNSWLLAVHRNEDFHSILSSPGEAFLSKLVRTQLMSRYPAVPEEGQPVLSEADRDWLKNKYGTGQWPELVQLLEAAGTEDFISFDLKSALGASSIHADHYAVPGPDFWETLALPAFNPSMQVLVIRYLKKKKKGDKLLRRSHRIGVYHKHGSFYFFDPNAGFIRFSDSAQAEAWLQKFWKHSAYAQYKAVDGVPLLSVYTLFLF